MATLAPTARTRKSRGYFSSPSRYLRHNHRIALRALIARQLVGPLNGARIVDLGCGNGGVAAQFMEANDVTCVDVSAAMLAEAHKFTEGRATYIEADIAGFRPAIPFDLALCFGVLAHVETSEPTIAAIARSLAAGGRCLLQFSDSRRPINRIARLIFAMRGKLRYRPTRRSDVIELAERHGLRPLSEQSHLLLLPGMHRLLGRWLVSYDTFVMRRPNLARLGMDTVLMLERREAPTTR